jgi:serine O-acetyltransferase
MISRDLLRLVPDDSLRAFFRTWLFHAGFRSVIALRIMNHFYTRNKFRIALLLRSRLVSKYGMDVFPGCKIGSGLRIEHSVGIVIGRGVVIGEDLFLLHGVTLGQKSLNEVDSRNSPRIGDRCTIGAYSCIVGDVVIPNNTFIRAQSLVSGKRKK